MNQSDSALNGIRVVAFELAVSGPFCSELLADMGAEVIKIERTKTGDTIRDWDGVVNGISSGYIWLNRNKRSLAIDVTSEDGRNIIHQLVKTADVFLENFAPGVTDRLGLGYQQLKSINSNLIYCSLSGYGQDGPYKNRKAFDLLIQGEVGFMETTGYPDQPAKVGPPVADLAAGMYSALGIVMALYQRERIGRGQFIDISMFDSLLSLMGYFPHYFWHRGEKPQRVGMRHSYITPYGPFLARDKKYVSLAVASSRDWELFCKNVLCRLDLWENPVFETTELRRKHRVKLEATIEEIFLKHDSVEWFERLKLAELPYGEVLSIDQVLDHPQVNFRNMIRKVSSPVGDVPVIANPLKMTESPVRYDCVPGLGQDVDVILTELGYDKTDIELLRANGVL